MQHAYIISAESASLKVDSGSTVTVSRSPPACQSRWCLLQRTVRRRSECDADMLVTVVRRASWDVRRPVRRHWTDISLTHVVLCSVAAAGVHSGSGSSIETWWRHRVTRQSTERTSPQDWWRHQSESRRCQRGESMFETRDDDASQCVLHSCYERI